MKEIEKGIGMSIFGFMTIMLEITSVWYVGLSPVINSIVIGLIHSSKHRYTD